MTAPLKRNTRLINELYSHARLLTQPLTHEPLVNCFFLRWNDEFWIYCTTNNSLQFCNQLELNSWRFAGDLLRRQSRTKIRLAPSGQIANQKQASGGLLEFCWSFAWMAVKISSKSACRPACWRFAGVLLRGINPWLEFCWSFASKQISKCWLAGWIFASTPAKSKQRFSSIC